MASVIVPVKVLGASAATRPRAHASSRTVDLIATSLPRLPHRTANEERAHLLDVLRGLRGFAHGLHARRERIKLRADQPDHEIVVVLVQAETCQAHVLRKARCPECMSDGSVLAQNR